jgi:hypothetical protein
MTERPDNILHLPQYQVLGCKSTDDEMHFQVDVPVTNAYTESINRLAKDKNREGRGYSFEVMRARMLCTTKHKKKAPTAKVSPFYKKTIGYGLPNFAEELNYGVDLSTI